MFPRQSLLAQYFGNPSATRKFFQLSFLPIRPTLPVIEHVRLARK